MKISATSLAALVVVVRAVVDAQSSNGRGNTKNEEEQIYGPVECTLYQIEPYMVNYTEPHEAKAVCEMDADYEDGIEGIIYEMDDESILAADPHFYADVEWSETKLYVSNAGRSKEKSQKHGGGRLKIETDAQVIKEKKGPGNNNGRGQGSVRGRPFSEGATRRLAPTMGVSSLLIVYAVPEVGPVNNDRTSKQIANELFGTPTNANLCDPPTDCTDDVVSARSQALDCSRGQLDIVPACGPDDPDPYGICATDTTGLIVNGVLEVPISNDVGGQSSGTVVNWATASAYDVLSATRSQPWGDGIHLANFTHVMHVIPSEVDWGGAAAWAYLPGRVSAFQDSYSYRMGVQMHEFGHNIALHHSGENGAAYADNSCLMGATSYGDDGPKVCWNAAKSWESGWYAADSLTVDPTEGFDGLLVGVADFANYTYTPGDHKVVLQILDESRSQDFYVIFNRKKGPNGEVGYAADRVTVTLGASRQVSWHQASLGINGVVNDFETFRAPKWSNDSNVEGAQDLVIKVCDMTFSSSGGPDTAHVLVYLDDGAAYNNGQMCPGEFNCIQDADCEEGDMCIINTCNTTTNTCNLPVDKTCQTTASLCDGKYECNSETGNCDFLDIDVLCDDGNSCSIDTCEADSCRHSSIPGCSVPGALMETWSGIEGVLVSDFTSVAAYPDSPDATEPLLNGFEAPLVDRGSNFGSRIRGYLVPFKSGDYTFYIASDDQGELMMSTSEDPDLATVIATVPGWAGSRDFWKYPAEQQSAPITLVKGMRYYIETKYKEGGGGDNMAVAWESPTSSANIPLEVISPEHIFMFPPEDCTSDDQCSDGSFCTSDSCNLETGLCEFAPIEGCAHGALLETWWNVPDAGTYSRTSVASLTALATFPDSPNETLTITDVLESPTNRGDDFGSRLRTYLVPPATGIYYFYIASDDNGQIWLSPNNNPSEAELIAEEDNWAGVRDWAGGGKSGPINLVKGQTYYLEALYKEGGGGDNMAIGWESRDNGISLDVISTTHTVLEPPTVITESPSVTASLSPSAGPTVTASAPPSVTASDSPSASPTVTASVSPSSSPTPPPVITESPSVTASLSPSAGPTVTVSAPPSVTASDSPSASPTVTASVSPSSSPTATTTSSPSSKASSVPSAPPTSLVSDSPSAHPSSPPTKSPAPFCNNDAICDAGEACGTCSDCDIETSGVACGNGRCEGGNGENSVSCPVDCAGVTGGKKSRRWYCGADIADGSSTGHDCTDVRCNQAGFSCTMDQVSPGFTCCGDSVCEGSETVTNCAADCDTGPSPTSAPTGGLGCPTPIDRRRNAACDFDCQCARGNCKGNGRCS